MREQPSSGELLKIARQVLKDDILPWLPKEQVYNALMVANAMAIAARQYDLEPLHREWRALQAFSAQQQDNGVIPENHKALTARVLAANQQLVKQIRAGDFDGADADREKFEESFAESFAENSAKGQSLADLLSLQVLQRVQESNPKALPGNTK